jgi:hypothetical protein
MSAAINRLNRNDNGARIEEVIKGLKKHATLKNQKQLSGAELRAPR